LKNRASDNILGFIGDKRKSKRIKSFLK
jgi:hypothetical protein